MLAVDWSLPPADEAGQPVARVILKPGKAKPFYARHPWVLDKAIDRIAGDAIDGDVVDIVNEQGKFVARGLFNSRSRIQVRLYTWNGHEMLDKAFWTQRIARAIELRQQLGYLTPTGGARLLFSEGDQTSGLIIDKYGEYIAMQVTSLGVARRLEWLAPYLVETLAPKGIYLRTERGVSQAEGLELKDGLIYGEAPDGPVFIEEYGLKYGVDVGQGQKTGFYLDQRENRLAAARYMAGRRVLDMFCYSGGFAMHAAKNGQAKEVVGIDSSEKAVAMAAANAELNELTNLRFESGEAFEVLNDFVTRGQQFDAVLLDPPKFARSRSAVDDALRAYFRLNRLAIDLLPPGGILVTSSCSGHVVREDFLDMLGGVAQKSGRHVQVLEQRGASADHPINTNCIETEYLKCMICRVV